MNWLALAGGAMGLAVVLYGVWILVTGRPTGKTARAFRTVREAGLYSLTQGGAVVLLATAVVVQGRVDRWASLALLAASFAAMALAIFRYRPRQRPTR